ncbi:hypothetical protein SERLA73DRAFT_72393 [Serpula lacrymans var. lacrymans S7.3]|uniref:FAD-binding domain-containing protein n=2 Tax=Serpula lacrymans var. lacrymans TaxID=341189 RepID=F8PVY7_SERL3|nr:uncharacterized protein SERLADRAFT_436915 [Serpula lacrymans var. lacrymans S7.9]EGN99583.1 hypothetical protein SERLA73DRAFT_72393 [Serpula lacrymans var. lacrymans S7.3]EGO25152.1 hypothetical protein SERLADRAFT_436915 [Serpula lacrymans var. lacrymans S7.9]
MTAADSVPVLIAGAGPSALVAALTLLQNGISIRIIEKEDKYRLGQRGAGLFPRSLELFHFLDVPEVDQRAKPLPSMRTYKPGTVEPLKTFSMTPYQDPTPAFPYFNPCMLGQQTLEGILRAHLEKLSCFVETGTELRSFEQFPDHVVAHVVKKRDGEEIQETIKATWLIGADGAKSVVRKQLGLTFLGETKDDLRLITGDIRLKGLDHEHWHLFGEMKTNLLVLRPTEEVGLDGYQFSMFGSAVNFSIVKSSADVYKHIASIVPTNLTFEELIWVSEFRANTRMVNKFGEGRVFVSGDAAHVHSPAGGQGLNSSVQDAFNLAWKISLVQKGLSPDSLLDSYTGERLPVIAEMINIATALFNKSTTANSSNAEEAFERNERLYMLGVNYRSSPIVLDEVVPPSDARPVDAYGLIRDGSLQAGDRAPDAPGLLDVKGAGNVRLFDIFRPHLHTVLVFTSDASKAARIISELRRYEQSVLRSVIVLPAGSSTQTDSAAADIVLEDKEGYAYKHYLVGDETRVVVVRPDGVAGAIVHGAEGMVRYFDKVFVSRS